MDIIGTQAATRGDNWLRKSGMCLLHFLVGGIGVFLVGTLLASILDAVSLVSVANAVFAGPVFFGDIGLGFLAGFTLNRKLRSKSAMWVWVLPAV